MKPVDIRNETFSSLKERLQGQRKAVYWAWQVYGPGTTKDVANRSAMSILTFRPRTTELYQMGAIMLLEEETKAAHGEGVYMARCETEWANWLKRQRQKFSNVEQLQML